MGTAVTTAHITPALSPAVSHTHTHTRASAHRPLRQNVSSPYIHPSSASYISREVTGSLEDNFNIPPHTPEMGYTLLLGRFVESQPF